MVEVMGRLSDGKPEAQCTAVVWAACLRDRIKTWSRAPVNSCRLPIVGDTARGATRRSPTRVKVGSSMSHGRGGDDSGSRGASEQLALKSPLRTTIGAGVRRMWG